MKKSNQKNLSTLILIVFCLSVVFTVFSSAAQPTVSTTTTTIITLTTQEISQIADITNNYSNYFIKNNGKVTLAVAKLQKDGYSTRLINYVENNLAISQTQNNNISIQPRSIANPIIKKTLTLLVTNRAVVTSTLNRTLGSKITAYLGVSKLIDAMIILANYNTTVDGWYTASVNYVLPSYLQWMTPTIVQLLRLVFV